MNTHDFPRAPLGFLPTPIIELTALSKHLSGPRLLMKRDDQTGLAFGGNKTRKLEFLIGEAIQQGCDTVVTGGAAQSNHCRQTAAAAVKYGLECHLALGGEPQADYQGNLLLDDLLNAKIHWEGNLRKGEGMFLLMEKLKTEGKKPYFIPYGGSNPTGSLGYVEAVRELRDQLEEQQISLTHSVFASSSGGTHAGLLVGARIYKQLYRTIGIGIDKRAPGEDPFDEHIRNIANQTLINLKQNPDLTPEDVILYNDYMGEGYGIVGDPEREAIRLLAGLEGIFLDPVYTGRAMAGMIDLIRKGVFSKDDTVLFWHTGGGPALFAYAEEVLLV
ncbi:MAG TPA: D-cysteine desulfhydrase family protein [Saprospirales bacterium]|nr:D-cysteine desulfhydrase family protein [Saprospirales bacterium]HAY70571.1 D-cysteine desulfhydrase family protein [Saprospirales bacterium]HRQ28554.1 D-cysteine desulfhydrase family protein [Saprospiraceae bacterium]